MAKTVRKDVIEFLGVWENCIIRILNASNSRRLKIELKQMTTLSSLELSNLTGIERK